MVDISIVENRDVLANEKKFKRYDTLKGKSISVVEFTFQYESTFNRYVQIHGKQIVTKEPHVLAHLKSGKSIPVRKLIFQYKSL